MAKWFRWTASLVALTLVLAACGPSLATPTPPAEEPATASPTATQEEAEQPTSQPVVSPDLPVDPDDWRALGSADAAVLIIEYSDFQ